MWFIRGRPTGINVRAFVESVDGGYQHNSLRFKLTAENTVDHDGDPSTIRVAIPFPYVGYKPDGSLTIDDVDRLSEFDKTDEEVVTLTRGSDDLESIEILGKLRDLKNDTGVELFLVQELLLWHLENIGVMIVTVKSGVTYQVNYTHKIAADSNVFFPTRAPSIVFNYKPDIDYKFWVKNVLPVKLHKYIVREQVSRDVDVYHYSPEFVWDDDTYFATTNWESSDDELSDDDQS